jgi:ABC-type nitrate/sulfonate/bicarbonate transport system permease component
VINIGLAAILPVALFVTWWLVTEHSKSTFYPPLSEILSTFRQEWLFANFTTDFLPSLYRITLGFTFSVIIGVGLGLLIGSSHAIRATVEPTLDFIRAVPATAILPLAVVLFGPSTLQKVSVITFGSVWAILLNTIDGVDGIDAAFHDVSRVHGFRRRDNLFRVVLPAATPQIFAGMRIALSTSVLLVVYSEMFASTNGVGYFVLNAQTLFEIPQMWSGIFVLALIALAANGVFAAAERRALFWHRGWKASQLGEATETREPRRFRWSMLASSRSNAT